ncbi:NeuD/PglB/VioB family sugar acetyltransferase [Hymenobacter latericus]|uniref:NeuD/PglB/VioB family sugar acetyltransferase n=1 Tax=Hymenobacter sp. YIM 151858-1 TaxID=2987688 RepID=UPI002227C505|nr:NeuD/PglB/VioB family sugar acetyltransferase [Hymenobacter sp. YIM 151858-1]UYZ57514.1 NeuD/PglB/VioB family sugar acetyltransferase [Hymenobacter sp. YIM 151858-1]
MTQLFFSEYEDPDFTGVRPLVIVGAGGLGREVLQLVRQINEAEQRWSVLGFYDDQRPAQERVHELPWLGTVADLNATAESVYVAVAVGSSRNRAAVVGRLSSPRLHFATLVHPSVPLRAYQQIQLGVGCIICQASILTCDIRLGRHVLINLGCTIGHDAVLEDFCSLMPHANVGGEAYLEAGVYLGTNATVINQVRVGTEAVVGAGAVVVRDLPAHCTAVGVPASVIKQRV